LLDFVAINKGLLRIVDPADPARVNGGGARFGAVTVPVGVWRPSAPPVGGRHEAGTWEVCGGILLAGRLTASPQDVGG
jgi:hypothetical protein